MVENRKFTRITATADETTSVVCAGAKEDVRILDLSVKGLRAQFPKRVEVGNNFMAKLKILPKSGNFFVSGKVIRVVEKDNAWETAVQFEKVSTVPFFAMYMYQMI